MPEAYQYSSEPRVIQTSTRLRRPKANQPVGPHANIMWDKRVVRGSTCTGVKNAEIVKAIQEEAEREAAQEERRVRIEQRRSAKQLELAKAIEAAAAAAAAAELAEARLVPDLVLLERPAEPDEPCGYDPLPPPVFVSSVAVAESSTQCEGQFFVDFDLAVAPIVQVLIGKTMQLAFNEVLEEEEQDAKEVSANDFDIVRNIELAEKQRLEEARGRKEHEKSTREREQRAREQRALTEHMHSQAHNIAKSHLEGLRGDVFNRLAFEDVFQDPVPCEIERLFFPALQDKMQKEADRMVRASEVTGAALLAAVDQGLLVHRAELARSLLAKGSEEGDLEVFKQGLKEITELGLTKEVEAARVRFGELYKADAERQHLLDVTRSDAAIQKHFGAAEEEGAVLDSGVLRVLSALLSEAELLGETTHVWAARARIAGIRVKASSAALLQAVEEAGQGAGEFEAAVEAGEGWQHTAREGARAAVDEGVERRMTDHQKEEEEEDEESSADPSDSEPPPAPPPAEDAAPEEGDEEAALEEEEAAPLGLMLLSADQVQSDNPRDAKYVTVVKFLAEFAPGLLERCLAKYHPLNGASLLSLFSSVGLPTSVLVDDSIELDPETHTPVHAYSPTPGLLWPSLLQKALVKVLGGWKQLCLATIPDLLLLLTGAAAAEIQCGGLREGAPERPGLGDIPVSEGSTELFEKVSERFEKSWIQICTVAEGSWGLPAGSTLQVLHVCKVPGEILNPPPEPDVISDNGSEDGTDRDTPDLPEVEPEPIPDTELVCVRLPEGDRVKFEGCLADEGASVWGTGGMLDALADELPDGVLEPGTVWMTAPELLNAVHSIFGFKSFESLVQIDPADPVDSSGSTTALTRTQALGTWQPGVAHGSNLMFELASSQPATILLTSLSDTPCAYSLRVLPENHSFVLAPATAPINDSIVVNSTGKSACVELALPGGGAARTVVVSHQTAGAVGGRVVLSACSMSEGVELRLRGVEDGRSEQRYDHRWKGSTAGGPPPKPRWRTNPVWRLHSEEDSTVSLAMEQGAAGAPVGLKVLRNADEKFTDAVMPEVVVLARSEVSHKPEVSLELPLAGGASCLVLPYTTAGVTQDYRLHVVSDQPVSTELVPPAAWQHTPGTFRPSVCGGDIRETPEDMASWLSNPQFRIRLGSAQEQGRVCVILSGVIVEAKPKPLPEPEPEPEPESGSEEEAAEGEEEGAEAVEPGSTEEEEEDEIEIEYYEVPQHGFVVVQNEKGGSEECVEEGFTELLTVAPATKNELSGIFDVDLTAGGPVFVVPCLTQTARAGEFALSALCADGLVYMEPTPTTRQAWLAPATPEPKPAEPEEEAPAEAEEQEDAK